MFLLLAMSLVQTFISHELNKGYSHILLHPKKWPALLYIPAMPDSAVETKSSRFVGLAPESCMNTGSCPVTLLLIGDNKSFALSMPYSLPLSTYMCVSSTS